MARKILIVVLIIVGLKYGMGYIVSDRFQKYGDDHKAQWTCQVNVFLGEIHKMLSQYDKAIRYFSPVSKRCPNTSAAEKADFRLAETLDNIGRLGPAINAYETFVNKYPDSKRAKIAQRAAGILRNNR